MNALTGPAALRKWRNLSNKARTLGTGQPITWIPGYLAGDMRRLLQDGDLAMDPKHYSLE